MKVLIFLIFMTGCHEAIKKDENNKHSNGDGYLSYHVLDNGLECVRGDSGGVSCNWARFNNGRGRR